MQTLAFQSYPLGVWDWRTDLSERSERIGDIRKATDYPNAKNGALASGYMVRGSGAGCPSMAIGGNADNPDSHRVESPEDPKPAQDTAGRSATDGPSSSDDAGFSLDTVGGASAIAGIKSMYSWRVCWSLCSVSGRAVSRRLEEYD